jgi:hypothetical protein
MRKILVSCVIGGTLIAAAPAGANPPSQADGPPLGRCPPAGGWTLRSIDEPGAAVLADINGDGWLCGRDIGNPSGLDNYMDNVIKKTA